MHDGYVDRIMGCLGGDAGPYNVAAPQSITAAYSADDLVDRVIERYRANQRTRDRDDKPKLTTGKFGDRGRFVTIDDHPVFVAEDGRINRGPRPLKGKHESETSGGKGKKRPQRSGERFEPKTRVDHAIVAAVGVRVESDDRRC